MMITFPVQVALSKKNVIVIGGGSVATRKVKQLLPYGPQITVISPSITVELQQLFYNEEIKWCQKEVEKEDLESAMFIIIATNKQEVNASIHSWKHPCQWINDSTSLEKSDFHIPGIIQRGDLCLTVSTNGASPSLTKKIKYELLDTYSDEYEEYTRFLREARQRVFEEISCTVLRHQILKELVWNDEFKSENRYEKFIQVLNKKKLNEEII